MEVQGTIHHKLLNHIVFTTSVYFLLPFQFDDCAVNKCVRKNFLLRKGHIFSRSEHLYGVRSGLGTSGEFVENRIFK